MVERWLVTGGAGFIGSHLTDYLLGRGATVRVLDNFATGHPDNLRDARRHARFTLLEGDVADAEAVRTACADVDAVVHLAALGSVPRSLADPLATHRANVTGFLNMMVAAHAAGVRRLVYASSSSVYGDHPALPKREDRVGQPLSPYAVSKYADELYAAALAAPYGMAVVGLRFFNVYGPRQTPEGPYAAVIPRFARAALAGERPTVFGDGEQTRDFTYVADAVAACYQAATVPRLVGSHGAFNVAGGRRVSLNELWATIAQISGSGATPRYEPPRPGDVRHSLADLSAAAEHLRYQPQTDLETGLRQTLAWHRQFNPSTP